MLGARFRGAVAAEYDGDMPLEEADLNAQLESLGARVRRRRDGSLHTVDFSSSPQAATNEVIAQLSGAPRLRKIDGVVITV